MMILKDKESHLNLSFLNVHGFNCMVFASSENRRWFGCGAQGHHVRSCPSTIAAGEAASEAPWSSAAAVAGLTSASATALGDSAVVVGPVAPVPMAPFTEGVPPTAGSPSVVEAPVTVEKSIVWDRPKALFDPSVEEAFVSQSDSEVEQPMDETRVCHK